MQLTPEQINDFIATAVMQSQIGEAVTKAVTKAVAELSKSYDNPFDAVIRNHVSIFIEKELASTFRPQLEARVKAAMETAITDEVMDKIINAAMEKMRSRY